MRQELLREQAEEDRLIEEARRAAAKKSILDKEARIAADLRRERGNHRNTGLVFTQICKM